MHFIEQQDYSKQKDRSDCTPSQAGREQKDHL